MESENFLRELLQVNAMEKAPKDLAYNVMKRIETQPPPLTAFKPLISKRGWVGIAAGILILCGLTLVPGSWLKDISMPEIPQILSFNLNWRIPEIPEISRTTLLGTLVFTAFSLVQIFWIKRQLSTRFKA
jgi:hypothetical protein